MARKRSLVAGVAASLAMLVMATPLAHASSLSSLEPPAVEQTQPPVDDEVQVDPESIIETIRNLEASDLPRVHTEIDGEPFTLYTLDSGATFAVPDNWDKPVPFISAGPAIAGPWIEWTPAEQQYALGVPTAVIAGIICSASGGVACPVATAAASAVAIYLGNNGGICSDNRRLLVEMTWTGGVRGIRCR